VPLWRGLRLLEVRQGQRTGAPVGILPFCRSNRRFNSLRETTVRFSIWSADDQILPILTPCDSRYKIDF
jgi:hypothetical protein